MKRWIALLVFALFFTSTTFAQKNKRCAVVEYHKQLFARRPQLKLAYDIFEQQVNAKVANENYLKTTLRTSAIAGDTATLHTIPVVVHIIHNNANGAIGGTNISDTQILSQMPVINKDFRRLNADTANTPLYFKSVAADMKFEFCMASVDPNGNATNGITRTYNPATSWDLSDDTVFKALSYWPSNQYLNIWVLPNITDTADGDYQGGILGYSQLPMGNLPGLVHFAPDTGAATDGIVILYQGYGDKGEVIFPYNLGRTVTHEIGHWLGGLRHPWGDCDPGCCTDYVDDTPWQDSADFDYAPCQLRTSNCNGPTDTLMIQNFMQYTGDNCMNLFTEGQKQRSRIAFYNCPSRVALLNSPGCGQQSLRTTSTVTSSTVSAGFTIYPNPLSYTYSVSYQLNKSDNVLLSVYNVEGILLKTLINTTQAEGDYTYTYNADDIAEGLYIFRFVSGGNATTKKIVVVK